MHIREIIGPSFLSNSQHTYMKGSSTVSALHSLVAVVEKDLEFKEYSLSIFLDLILGPYISSENNVFIKISMGMILNYAEISVAAKMSLKFRGSVREIPKNRSKFTKNAIFDLFFLAVQTSFSVVEIMDGFSWEYLDASKMLGDMQTFCRRVKVNFFLKIG